MIVVYCSRENIGKNWVKAVADELGKDKVCLLKDVVDPMQIQIALTWKAPFEALQQFPNLKLIQSLGAGVDHIFDNKNVVEGAKVSRIIDPQLSTDMFEFVLAIVLDKMKNLHQYRDQQVQRIWKEKRYKSVNDVCMGILGLGVIGSFVSKKLSDFGFQCMGWSGTNKNIEGVQSYTGEEGLNVMLNKTDYLINLLPLTNATRGFINLKLLEKIKPGAYVINVGRGPHVVDGDLLEAIDKGLISGAALDVFHQEPLPIDHPYWVNKKIFLTPHIASITNINTARKQVFENIRRFDQSENFINEVDVSKGY